MLYGAETWALGRQQANKLMATEINFPLKAGKKSRKEKIRVLKISEIMNFEQHF